MKKIRKFMAFLIATIMMASNIAQAFASTPNYASMLSNTINKDELPVKVAKLTGDQTAEKLIENPKQPAIYTLRTDYKVQRGEKYEINYQPYIASVGEAATQAEKDKVKKTIDLPALAGYDEPQDNFTIDYDTIVKKAKEGTESKDANNGDRYNANQDFKYTAKSNTIKIKHVFQDLEDFTKYTNPDGTVGDDTALFTTQNGNTGSTMEVSPLGESDPNRKGFVPERKSIIMQVPENAENFILEYRYNRAHYDVTFDTAGGTPLPARTLYYGQVMPKIADESIPTKVGGEFQGWKPSVDLKTEDGKTFKANEIIAVGTGGAIKNLDVNLLMPASKVTFTAVRKDKDKAGYAVQFWAEKADHSDGASLLDKYDYIGTRVYKDQATGSRPDLDNVSVKDIVFPDLDQARLNKIWNGNRFNRGNDLYLNKFYVYNQALTHDQNKDPANVNLVKSVDSTGKTVYNIYFDRQVYDLYFTKSNALDAKNTFYPEIWGYDKAQGVAVKKGGPGNPYHYKARFNQLMLGWPNDAMQTKGFSEGMQSFGWGPNFSNPAWPTHLDTPPYRLNADQFLDMENYDKWGGYVKKIDKGDGTSLNLDWSDYKILSFGIKQAKDSMPHHMDFWMDGFKDGETIIRYDLYRYKADTSSDTYAPSYPRVQGFTGKRNNETPEYLDSDGIDAKNEERAEVTPFPDKTYTDMYGARPVGKMKFIKAFFNNGDEWGDPDGWDGFDNNGYLKFEYTRNKYPLRFNYDPSVIKGDNEFDSTNSLETFYEFPLKALSPDADTEESYNTENPKNLLDNPEKLQELGLTDLVFTDTDGKLKVKRPDNLSDQMVFKGWALDPAGTKLIRDNGSEKMPSHPVNLYAKWDEPDYQWKVTFDPNGGNLRNIKEEDLTTSRKTIQEGDIDQEETKTFAKKEANDGDKQVFTVIQRQKLVEPKFKPTRKGYDFMGWEVIRYKKDEKGDYTDQIDTSYRDTYKVPELYSFGNDVVAPVYLKAIWTPNERVDVKVEHYMFDKDYKLIKKLEDTLEDKRANYLVATTGDKQNDEFLLAPHEELEEKLTGDLKTTYEEYNKRVGLNNSFFQTFRVEPAQILNTETNKLEDNPKVTDNVFKFFYRPFRQREYKVNYIDERFKGNPANGKIIDQELVSNGNRHYDARNYRPINGWVLTSAPQQQLFFDVNEKTNEFIGINGTKSDEITFYYKDVRVIEVPKDGKTPEGYVRVTFKADKGGSFGKDAQGKDITELNYDVIQGLKSDLLPVPQELKDGEGKVTDKYYITPETGKKFTKWDNSPLLNKNTIINEDHTFTAYFEWSGLTATGLVRTEAFKDPSGTWTNDFAPTIDQLKKQLVWKEKDEVKDLPAGAVIKLYDEAGNELTSDEQVFALVNEKKAADKDELVRTVNVKAKVTFKDGKEPQELTIPITVYKNVYEALNKEGDKPLFLKEAEGKDAKDGGLKDVTGNYVKVIVQPTEKNTNKDAKVYYVNPKAWVNIPEVEWSQADKDKADFLKWTADKDAQNENGVFDFSKRHKFTDEETLIKPLFTKDVVEQKEGEDKPKVPDNFVKVIVNTTDKATSELTQIFWVNPTKEVTIPVTEPTGKENQKVTIDGLGEKTVNYIFKEWQKVQTGQADDSLTKVDPAVKIDLAKNQYTDKVTVIEAVYKKSIQAEPIVKPLKTTKLDTPQGKEITNDDLIKQITPQEGKEIESIEVISNPDPSNPGKTEAKVIVKYKDGTTQGTKDNPVVIPVEVHKNIIPEAPGGQRPKDALDNYVKVIFKAGTGGSVSGDTVYYVSPEVEVDMTESAKAVTKTPEVGYTANGEKWTNKDNKTLKGTFTDSETEFVFNFDKSKDIVEKTDDNVKKPDGYVEVIFKTEDENKGKLEEDKLVKIYYVNPKAGIKLVEGKAGDNELAVPDTKADENYKFIKWFESIDKTTPITGNREYVAIFGKTEVNLSYGLNGGSGNAPQTKTVPYGTSVRLATDEGISKKDAKFIGWDIDGTVYKPGAEITLTKDQKAIAKWTDDENIISYNPKDPITRPAGYVRVTFKADKGLSLTEEKAYYVKADKGLILKDIKEGERFGYPTYTEETGYRFDKWDKDDSTVIDKDIELTAKATEAKDVVPKTKEDESEKPKGFVKVTFVSGENGKLGEETNTFFVNPNKYVKLSPPSTQADTGYIFAGWDKNATEFNIYDKDTTITASFNPIDYVIAKTKDDESEKPSGYVTVNFVIDPATGGKIVEKEIITYYVKPNTEVTIPQPQTKAEIGYEFDKWDRDTSKKVAYSSDTTVKGTFKELAKYIPSKDGDKENKKPEGYIEVVFKADENGSLEGGDKTFYVNPDVKIDENLVNELAKAIVKKPNEGYTAEGGNWEDKSGIFSFLTKNKLFVYHFKEAKNVIPDGNGEPIPSGFVKVTLRPTDKATDSTEKSYWVNPKEEVEIPFDNPEGKTVKDKDHQGYTTTYTFKEWKVIKGSLASYKGKPIKGQFKEETVLEATYTENTSGKMEELLPAPKAKKDTIVPKDGKPKAEDLIENIPGQGKDPLPDGTKISYEKDGEPDTTKPGSPKAKVKIEYPNGKTVVVDVPIKVVDHIVPQEGNDKPDVPANYVKVVVDTTDKATENTYFVKTYWVNPEVEVILPVRVPSGKSEEIDGVTSQYEFSSWKLEASDKDYGSNIKDTFTAKESKIVATYKTDKNIEPEGNDGLLIPEDESPDPRDFIKNDYDDKDPKNKNNLPPGTKFTFKEGEEPKTDSAHEGRTTIVVEYPNGEKKEIEVGYRVVGKVVPQEGEEKPEVPDDYVKVSLDPTEKSDDKEKIYWVRPRVEVTIPDYEVKGKDKWIFKGWDKNLTDVFMRDTEIRAIYSMETLKTSGSIIVTEKDKQPEKSEYRKRIQIQEEGEEARDLTDKDEIHYDEPDVSTLGDHTVKVKVKLEDGTELETEVIVRVVDTIYELDKDNPENNENIPDNYIQVIVVPTTDNMDSEEHYYAVKKSENADDIRKIQLPKIDPVEGKTFLGWEVRKGTSKYESYDKNGEAFTEPVNIIREKFVDDMVIQVGDNKPEVPEDYVKVVVDRTDYARKPKKTIYWVNPKKEVDLGEVDPSAKDGYSFKGWKLSEKKKEEDKDFNEVSDNFDLEGKKHKYEAFETHIEAVFEKISTPKPNPDNKPVPNPDDKPGSNHDQGNPHGGKDGDNGKTGNTGKEGSEDKGVDGSGKTNPPSTENTNNPSNGTNDDKTKGEDGKSIVQAQPSESEKGDNKVVTSKQANVSSTGSNKTVFSKVKTGVRTNLGIYLTIITISVIGYVLSKKK